eukprot:701971-Pyramimonas_sp.AAC.1
MVRVAKQQLAALPGQILDIENYGIQLPITDQCKHLGGQLSSLSGMGPELAYRGKQMLGPLGI